MLRNNVISNYIGITYTIIINILILPLYMNYLVAEAFGLFGFFTLLQTCLAMLTAGMSPTLARQVAYARGCDEIGSKNFRILLRSIELIIISVGLLTILAVWCLNSLIAEQWLKVSELPQADVSICIGLMGTTVGIRWFISFYQGGIRGFESHIWLNIYNIIVSTVRLFVAYFLLRWVSNDPIFFFLCNLVISFLELIILWSKFYNFFNNEASRNDPGFAFSISAIRNVISFSSGIAYTSMLWIFMTQIDKFILSHILTLTEYGYLSMIIVIANGILQFSEPITQAVLPRMTTLYSEGLLEQMIELYRKTSQYLAVIISGVSGIVAMYSDSIIYAISGNMNASIWGGEILTWFSLANGLLAIVGLQYLLQFVHGKLKIHIISTTINALIQVPILIFVTVQFGAVGIAATFFFIRLASLFIWPFIVHRKFIPGLHIKWFIYDICIPVGSVFICHVVFNHIFALNNLVNILERWEIFGILTILCFVALLTGSIAASSIRGDMMKFLIKFN